MAVKRTHHTHTPEVYTRGTHQGIPAACDGIGGAAAMSRAVSKHHRLWWYTRRPARRTGCTGTSASAWHWCRPACPWPARGIHQQRATELVVKHRCVAGGIRTTAALVANQEACAPGVQGALGQVQKGHARESTPRAHSGTATYPRTLQRRKGGAYQCPGVQAALGRVEEGNAGAGTPRAHSDTVPIYPSL